MEEYVGSEHVLKALENNKYINFQYAESYDLKEQYYKLRENYYRQKMQLKDFVAPESDNDTKGEIIVAVVGDVVVAGLRMIVSTPENRNSLSFEEEGFTLDDIFPEMGFNTTKYSEFSMIALDKHAEDRDVFDGLFAYAIKEARKKDCLYQLSISPVLCTNDARGVDDRLRIVHYLRPDIQVPQKPELYGMPTCLNITYFHPALFDHHDYLLARYNNGHAA